MSKRTVVIIGLIGLLVAGCLVIVILASHGESRASAYSYTTSEITPLPNSTPVVHPQTGANATPAVPAGIPAIRPQVAMNSGVRQTFSASDVENYVKNHPMAEAVVVAPLPQAVKVEFLTSREVNISLNVRTNLPDNTRVSLVTLQGSFQVSGPQGAKTKIVNTAYQVFDAQSGNLVLEVVKTH